MMRGGYLLSPLLLLLSIAACTAQRPVGSLHPVGSSAELRALLEAARQQSGEDPPSGTEADAPPSTLPSFSAETRARRAAARDSILDRLQRLDPSSLSRAERIDYEILERTLSDQLASHAFGAHRIPITADWGFHMWFAQLPSSTRFATTADYESYIARLLDFPRYVGEHVAAMREGLESGFTLPAVALEGYELTIAPHVVEDPVESALYAPFLSFPPGVPASEHARLRAAGRAAVEDAVVPGFRSFLSFMVDEYLPGARRTIAASDLPDGRAYYEHLVRHFTTLDLAPEQVHALGLAEVARIRAEMEEVIRSTGFDGTFQEFVAFLRTDPRFYPESPDHLLREAAFIAKTMDGRLPALFDRLPRQPYGIEAVPAEIAPRFTGGRYIRAAPGSPRGGYYWVNTHALENRPLYVLESLTLHEAVPGHHLQIALQLEMEDLPPFRRTVSFPAFVEGWALYAERLGLESGFYTDPYSNFGRLTYEMWRACRLVVDTGMHAFGWSRQQAMDYLAANTALSLHEVRTETDRYISWPGQALAYKVGELKIRELRAEAEAELGLRFDLREFHDAVLRNGEVPLPILEDEVRSYIREALSTAPAGR